MKRQDDDDVQDEARAVPNSEAQAKECRQLVCLALEFLLRKATLSMTRLSPALLA